MAGSSEDYGRLTGRQKAAIMLMSIEEEKASKLFGMMDDEEIKEVSQTMAGLGHVGADVVERLFLDFADQMSAAGVVFGTVERAERLLVKALGKDRVSSIMEEIRGPAGKNTWEKLSSVNEDLLAAYLKNEHPQTTALILSKVNAEQTARVLSILPEDTATEVIMRMLQLDSVKKEVLDEVEKTLRMEFMSNVGKTQRRDSYEVIADVFNNLDRNKESAFMTQLEDKDSDAAERVRSLMFTFDDLARIDAAGIQALLRGVDKDRLGLALKGAPENIKELFFANMSERAAKILREDMDALGPVRLRDVDEAQLYIVMAAKEMAAKGEITIADNKDEEELVY